MSRLLSILIITISFNTYAFEDTLKSQNKRGSYFDVAWAPVGLSLISVDLMRDSAKFGLQRMARSMVKDDFYTHADDFLQFAPSALMYGADILKIPAKNTPWHQTKFLVISEMINGALTLGMKYAFGIQRPNNGAITAYPSGHTSQTFVQCQVLFNEFKDTAPALAYSGYSIGVTVASLRVLKNKHWVPDVIMGAGLAMLVVNTVYYFEPLKDWNPWKDRKNRKGELFFTPSFGNNFYGGNLRVSF
ncbi:MAG: phosphatase PAP2 family protein [Crocinitomicaceae bacterium]|nr:phosphatase PAP2 family protein [Crocinitomicaceae bacterium]